MREIEAQLQLSRGGRGGGHTLENLPSWDPHFTEPSSWLQADSALQEHGAAIEEMQHELQHSRWRGVWGGRGAAAQCGPSTIRECGRGDPSTLCTGVAAVRCEEELSQIASLTPALLSQTSSLIHSAEAAAKQSLCPACCLWCQKLLRGAA